jgi:hypothetical protein
MKIKQLAIVCLCGLCMAASSVNGAEIPPSVKKLLDKMPKDAANTQEVIDLIRKNMHIQDFREKGMKDITTFDGRSLFREYTKWMQLQKMFKPVVWGDFFTGAILMSGASDGERQISALYNPWWDAIFLMCLEMDKNKRYVVTAFKIRCGESFRDEKIALDKPSLEPLTGTEGKPLPLVWMELLSKTTKVFDDKYGNTSYLKNKWAFDENDEELNNFDIVSRTMSGARAVAHLRLLQTMFGDMGITHEMMNWLKVLREATEEQVTKLLGGDDLEMFKLLVALGPEIREGITPYGYWGTETERQYLFISGDIPRFAMMVYVHVGQSKDIEFEWFDMGLYKEYFEKIKMKNVTDKH